VVEVGAKVVSHLGHERGEAEEGVRLDGLPRRVNQLHRVAAVLERPVAALAAAALAAAAAFTASTQPAAEPFPALAASALATTAHAAAAIAPRLSDPLRVREVRRQG